MKTNNFTTSISVAQTPADVFQAIGNVRAWWSEEIEGKTTSVNDVFKYHYEDVHACQIKVTEVVHNKKIKWLVLDNYFNFTQDKTEWKGTEIIFEILGRGEKTQLKFTHLGLVPAYECYNACHEGWTNYIQNSLRKLIITGKGEPNRTGKPRTETEGRLSRS